MTLAGAFKRQVQRGSPLRWGDGGFSFIEVMIVIGLIAVVCVLSVSSIGRIRTESNRTACIQNLRSIGVAQQLYSTDHQNFFPPTRQDLDDGTISSWAVLLRPYLGKANRDHETDQGPSVFRCPQTKDEFPHDPLGYIPSYFFDVPKNSYSQNIVLGGWLDAIPIRRRSEVEKPSKMVLVTEARFLACGYWSIDEAGYPPTDGNGALYRHNDRLNLLFVDGHVETSAYPISPSRGNQRYNWEIGLEHY